MEFVDKWICFYREIDADVGTRLPKRDKSTFVVGYRLHTLTVIDAKTYAVRKNSSCSVNIIYAGCDDQYGHEFHCHAQPGDCPFEGSCHKVRYIPVDSGAVRKIPYFLDGAQKLVAMRKVAERPFNLIKHRDGLEPLRTKGIHNSTVVAIMANIATLLIEIEGHRKKVITNKKQHRTLAFEFMKKAA